MIIPFLTQEDFGYRMSMVIVVQICIMICMAEFAKRKPTDYDTKYMRRWRIIMGISWLFLAIGGILAYNIMPEALYYRFYYLYVYGTATPSEAMLQTGISPFEHLRLESPLYGRLTFQQWFIESTVKNIFSCLAIGLYFLRFKPSSVKKWVKIRKGIGYFCLLYLLPASIDFHYLDIWEWMPVVFILIVVYFLTRSYKIDAVVPVAQSAPVGLNGDIIEDFRPIAPDEKDQIVSKGGKVSKDTMSGNEIESFLFWKKLSCSIKNTLCKKRSFEDKVNILLLCVAFISLVISFFGFGYRLEYYNDEGFLWQWLIASFISAVFAGIWFFLNWQHFSFAQSKKYGISLIVASVFLCLSPFIALTLLIEGTILFKKAFYNPKTLNDFNTQDKTTDVVLQEFTGGKVGGQEEPPMSAITEIWSLMDFAQMKGSPKRAILTNQDTGEEFAAVIFPTPQGDKDFTMVAFNSSLGELSAKEIAEKKNSLSVVRLESGNYYLCDNAYLEELRLSKAQNEAIESNLQFWIDGSLKDLQSMYLKVTLSSAQQLQAIIYLVSLICDKANAPTEQIIKYVTANYFIPENLLLETIKGYKYYRALLSEDYLAYTCMIVSKLCVYSPETSIDQIVKFGKENNLKRILEKFPQHEVITNNVILSDKHELSANDVADSTGSYRMRSLSIDIRGFEQISFGLAYSLEILK